MCVKPYGRLSGVVVREGKSLCFCSKVTLGLGKIWGLRAEVGQPRGERLDFFVAAGVKNGERGVGEGVILG